MRIEVVIIGIWLMFIAYGLGYLIGYRHCFEDIHVLSEKFNKEKEKKEDEM